MSQPYCLVTHKNGSEEQHYRLGHPLASAYLRGSRKEPSVQVREVVFNYGQHEGKITLVEHLKGETGWLCLSLLTIQALEEEDYLVFSGGWKCQGRGDLCQTFLCFG